VTEVKRAQRSSSQSEFEGRNWLLTCCRTLILSRDHRDAVNYSVSELHSTTYYYALLHITAYCCQPLQVNSNYIPPGSLILRLTLPGTDNCTLLYTIAHCYRQLHSAIHHYTLLQTTTLCYTPLYTATDNYTLLYTITHCLQTAAHHYALLHTTNTRLYYTPLYALLCTTRHPTVERILIFPSGFLSVPQETHITDMETGDESDENPLQITGRLLITHSPDRPPYSLQNTTPRVFLLELSVVL